MTNQPTANDAFVTTECDTCNRIGPRNEPNPVIDKVCRHCGGNVTRREYPDERSMKKTLRIHRRVRPVDYGHDVDTSKTKKPLTPML